MAMAMARVLAGLCALVVAMSVLQAPAGVEAQCSLAEVQSCSDAVQYANQMPSEECCARLAAVNVPCFCNLVETSSYPRTYVDRALLIPKLCGDATYAHFRGTTCAGHTFDGSRN